MKIMKFKSIISALLLTTALFYMGAEEAYAGKQILSITVFGDNYGIDNYVRLFNQSHPGAEISVNRFNTRYDSFDEDYEKYKTQTEIQLMSGLSDDIIDAASLSHLKLAAGGLLAGLFPLMENDAEFDRDDYYMNVLEALSYKNELYIFPLYFMYTMIGTNSNISDLLVEDFKGHSAVSDRDLLDIYKAAENTNGFFMYDGFDPIRAVADNIDWFIDYENKKCYFNSAVFINMITDAKQASEGLKTQSVINYSAGIQPDAEGAGKYLFKRISADSSGYRYLLPYEEFGEFDSFIPKANNKGQVYVYPWMRFCISENSKNKELAWEFLKFLSSPAANADSIVPFHPINKNVFNMNAPDSAERFITDFERQGYYLSGDRQRHIYELVNTLGTRNEMPMISPSIEDFYEIIAADLEKFCSGAMTAELTAANLQNKITMALLE